MVVENDIDDRRDGRQTIRKEEIPLLQVAELQSIVSAPKDEIDVCCHAEDLVAISKRHSTRRAHIPRASRPS